MFVVIEGPNGSGKTTLKNKFKKDGIITLSSPAETPLSSSLRNMCRGVGEWSSLDKFVKMLLFSAARYDEFINIVLANKDLLVIADRWWTSTYVYQCILEGIPVPHLEFTVHPEEKIDLCIILKVDAEKSFKRSQEERQQNKEHSGCTWTKEKKQFEKISNIYYNELPKYLEEKNIKTVFIDVNDLNEDEVYQKAGELILFKLFQNYCDDTNNKWRHYLANSENRTGIKNKI